MPELGGGLPERSVALQGARPAAGQGSVTTAQASQGLAVHRESLPALDRCDLTACEP